MGATRPKADPNLDVLAFETGMVVYAPATEQLHSLNASAALVFSLCDGTATRREIAETIAEQYGLNEVDVEQQVRSVLRDLRDFGLLATSPREGSAEPDGSDDPRGAERVHI